MKNCETKFVEIYKRKPEHFSYSPYRICPLGAHIDHQKGIVTGFAIDKGIHFAFSKKGNGIIEVQSVQYDKRAQWTIDYIPSKKENDWADYLRGVTIALKKRYPLNNGLCGVFDGEMPIGGLSSSAAISLAYLMALCKINNLSLSKTELIEIAKEAENEYVGVACGILDQSCEVLSKENKLLYLDTKDGSYELVEPGKELKPFMVAIFFSGLERNLATSNYNMRADECKAAAYALKAYCGLEYGKFKDSYLRDVDEMMFNQKKDNLPINWKKRAEHYFTEMNRVQLGKKYWQMGDLISFGKLIFESGESSINNYEVGSEQLTKLQTIISKQKGVYGCRFSGAGFKGSCIALIDPNMVESISEAVEKEYLEAFPYLENKYKFYVCKTADGIGE